MIEGLTGEAVAFAVFAGVALGAAVAVVTMRNLVHGALMLVIHLLAVAGLYLALESQFLAIVQVLVYAGAIVVLFLFVIMLLGVDRDDLLIVSDRRRVAGIVAAGLLVAGAMTAAFVGPYTGPALVCGSGVAAIGNEQPCIGLEAAKGPDDAGVAFLGRRLFTRYTLVFELSAVLLTVATIGAVILARRRDLVPEDEDEQLVPVGDAAPAADPDAALDAASGVAPDADGGA